MANPAEIYAARIVCVLSPQIGVNVLHAICTAKAGTGATDAQIAASIDTLVAANYKALIQNNATYRGVGARRIFPTLGLESTSVASTGVGTAGANGLPLQVSGLLHIATLNATRKGRGRIYIPFPSTAAAAANGTMAAAYTVLLNALGATLSAGFSSGGGGNTNTFNWCLWHRASNTYDAWSANAQGTTKFATQRRRGDYGRQNAVPF